MIAERLAATLAAASFLAATCRSFSGTVADRDSPKIFLRAWQISSLKMLSERKHCSLTHQILLT